MDNKIFFIKLKNKNRLTFLNLIITFLIIILFVYVFLSLMHIFYKKILYPLKYEEIVEVYSKEMNVDKFLIYSIIRVESNFNSKSTSKSGAKGLMQLMDNTAKECAKDCGTRINLPNDLFDPKINIKLGTFYIKKLLMRYNSNLPIALAAYNAGSGNVSLWFSGEYKIDDVKEIIKKIKFSQTKNYVSKVMSFKTNYKNFYKK